MGYHRLLTHRGYAVPRWLEHFLAVCATLSLEGGPLVWVATHRVHHQLTDRPGDPHTPHEGGWWSHAGWVIHGSGANAEPGLLAKYVPDLMKDGFYRGLNRYHWVPLTLLALVLLAVGGWSWVLWGIFLRVTLGLHSTWLVNSATHMWGSRRFATRDDSRNNWWVALLTGGEGWHNNHHAYPVSARHGLAWYEFDLNYCGIWIMGKLGLAKTINAMTTHIQRPWPRAFRQKPQVSDRPSSVRCLLRLSPGEMMRHFPSACPRRGRKTPGIMEENTRQHNQGDYQSSPAAGLTLTSSRSPRWCEDAPSVRNIWFG
jgi:fatty-acid desaturase